MKLSHFNFQINVQNHAKNGKIAQKTIIAILDYASKIVKLVKHVVEILGVVSEMMNAKMEKFAMSKYYKLSLFATIK